MSSKCLHCGSPELTAQPVSVQVQQVVERPIEMWNINARVVSVSIVERYKRLGLLA